MAGTGRAVRLALRIGALAVATGLAGCAGDGRLGADGVYAPGLAGRGGEDQLLVGHRLMAANEPQLALDAYMRAAADQGLTPDTLAAMGSANLSLGRLGQAERLLREAVKKDALFVSAWNNLGVLLMERGEYGEASEAFRRAYAADSGATDTIRDNLRLALARMEDPFYTGPTGGGLVIFNDVEGGLTAGAPVEGGLSPEDALLEIEPL